MHHRAACMFFVATWLLPSAGRLLAEELSADVLVVDSFEEGTDAPDEWNQGPPVPGVTYVYDQAAGSGGKRSLSLQKSANSYFPIAGWSRALPHNSKKPVLLVTAKVKASKVTKAIIDVLFVGANGNPVSHEWAAYIGQNNRPKTPIATHDWKTYSGAVKVPAGTTQIVIGLQIYGPGKVWFDELEACYFDSLEAAKAGAPPAKGTSSTPSADVDSDTETVEIPPAIEIKLSSGDAARYLLIPPEKSAAKPKGGYPLLLVLPGGNGSAEFHPFIRRVHKQAFDGRFVVAQPLAPAQVVWPTRSSASRSATTEESIAAIIDDVAKSQSIDRAQVYALAWSSSGPAIYATLLQDKSPLAGALIAMSVYKPDQLPPLTNAKGRRVYLLHSPEDSVCPYRMAKEAEQQLAAAGAKVSLVNYAGGHGWKGPVYDNIRAGLQWLQGP